MECFHPFILELVQTYNSPNQLFMLMECVQGGELWSYIYEKFEMFPRTNLGGFEVNTARFYAACVVSAFGFIHNIGVAYRDLKVILQCNAPSSRWAADIHGNFVPFLCVRAA